MSAADSDKPDARLPAFKPREPLALSMPQREAVIERLTRAFAEDAITMDEFERRAEHAYRATSMADLQTLISDLPSAPEPTGAAPGKRSDKVARVGAGDNIRTMWGSTERGMPGVLPRFLRIRTFMGNTELDFRQSTFEPGITEVDVRCLMGNVELTVPEGVRVELLCSSVLANVGMMDKSAGDALELESSGEVTAVEFPARPDPPAADVANALQRMPAASLPGEPTPRIPGERVLRITGRAMLGNVEVHRGSPRREP